MPTHTVSRLVRAGEEVGPSNPQPDESDKGRQPPAPPADHIAPGPAQDTAPRPVSGYVTLNGRVDGCQMTVTLWANGADATTVVRVLNALQGTLDALESHSWPKLKLKSPS